MIILFIYALASSCATLHSMFKSCDPMNKALEVSYTGGYIPIQPTDFVYIWHCLSHNYPRTTDKISSRYFYYFHRQTHKHHILLYTIIQGAADRHRERLLVVSQRLMTEAHLNGYYMTALYDWESLIYFRLLAGHKNSLILWNVLYTVRSSDEAVMFAQCINPF